MLPLYGLADSGGRWHHTLDHHHVSDFRMEKLDTAPSFYFRSIVDRLVGLSGVYVDHLLRAGDDEFENIVSKTSKVFDSTPAIFDEAKFAGVHFKQHSDYIATDMDDYITKISLYNAETFGAFRSNRAKLAWIVYARPDICATVAKLAQITETLFEEKPKYFLTAIAKTFKYLGDNRIVMKYPKLEKDIFYIRAYSDASFVMRASNPDGSSQIGFCIFKGQNWEILTYQI